ncbi:MAG: hypothetical protein J6W84_03455 [Bacteroidales bacterium]|nr:hypothetical protein [Bacteroidales bacterium]
MSFDIPDGFRGCGITMVYEDENGLNMYSTSITPAEVGGDKVLVLPRNDEEVE